MIQLSTKEKIGLFGEDYYNDKKMFWEVHHSMLTNLCEKVNKTGFPIIIIDVLSTQVISLRTKQEFEEWLINNQPF